MKDADLHEYPKILLHYQNLNEASNQKKSSTEQKLREKNSLYTQKVRPQTSKYLQVNDEQRRNQKQSLDSTRTILPERYQNVYKSFEMGNFNGVLIQFEKLLLNLEVRNEEIPDRGLAVLSKALMNDKVFN